MILAAQRLLDEAFAVDASATIVLKRLGPTSTVHTFLWGEGVSAGAVAIEGGPSVDYPGTWAPLGAITFDGSTTPAPKAETFGTDGSYPVMRHRITEPVEGGTLTSRCDASGA